MQGLQYFVSFYLLRVLGFDRASAVSNKRLENILLKRPPVPRSPSSHEGLSEVASNSVSRVKVAPTTAPSEGIAINQLLNSLLLLKPMKYIGIWVGHDRGFFYSNTKSLVNTR